MPLLTPAEVRSVTDAAIAAGLADPTQRQRLLDGVDIHFRAFHLRLVDQPGGQILADLVTMNQVEQLADGSVPLHVWLQNAIYLTRDLAQPSKTFNVIMAVLNSKITGQPAIPRAAELPEIKERVVHRDDRLPFSFLAKGYATGASVARLVVPAYVDGAPRLRINGMPKKFVGTGWLMTSRLLITNHHVINAREEYELDATDTDFALQAAETNVEFDYDSDAAERTIFRIEEIVFVDRELDFAILRLSGAGTRSPLPIRTSAIVKQSDDYIALNIIQHPAGQPKMVAIRNNLLTHADATALRYFTDTSGGASGSPVLSDDWNVVALHRASTPVDNVIFQGRTTAWVNVGTPIRTILDRISEKDPSLASEIEKEGQLENH